MGFIQDREKQLHTFDTDWLRHVCNQGRTIRDDQEALAFLVSQLAYTEARVYEKLGIKEQFRELVPVSTEAGEGAESIDFVTIQKYGRAKLVSGEATDIAVANVAYGRKSVVPRLYSAGYHYTLEELRKAAYPGNRINLPADRADAAVMMAEKELNQIALFGSDDIGVKGLFNQSGVTVLSTATAWASATEAQILADINEVILKVWNDTAFNDWPNTVIFPPSVMGILARPRSSQSDKTILAYIQENNVAKISDNVTIRFTSGFGLDTAGAGNTKRMIAYVNDRSRMVMHVTIPLRFLPPQFVGYAVKIPGEFKVAGLSIPYIKSIVYKDGI